MSIRRHSPSITSATRSGLNVVVVVIIIRGALGGDRRSRSVCIENCVRLKDDELQIIIPNEKAPVNQPPIAIINLINLYFRKYNGSNTIKLMIKRKCVLCPCVERIVLILGGS